MLCVNGLKAGFKSFELGEINISVNDGEIYGICGQSGSGKTMLLSVLSGMFRKFEGSILLDTSDISRSLPANTSSALTVPPQDPDFTIGEYLYLSRRSIKKRLSFFSDEDRHDLSLTESSFKLNSYSRHKFKHTPLSVRRLAAAAAQILQNRKILLLDSPSDGMDPLSLTILRNELIKYSRKSNIILISSNDLNFLTSSSDTVSVMSSGKIVLEGSSEILSETNIKSLFKTGCSVLRNLDTGKDNYFFL